MTSQPDSPGCPDLQQDGGLHRGGGLHRSGPTTSPAWLSGTRATNSGTASRTQPVGLGPMARRPRPLRALAFDLALAVSIIARFVGSIGRHLSAPHTPSITGPAAGAPPGVAASAPSRRRVRPAVHGSTQIPCMPAAQIRGIAVVWSPLTDMSGGAGRDGTSRLRNWGRHLVFGGRQDSVRVTDRHNTGTKGAEEPAERHCIYPARHTKDPRGRLRILLQGSGSPERGPNP